MPDKLPYRVLAAIEAQDEATERLIGWVQLGVFTVLGSFYFIAPKTFTADAPFAPVPWALGAYFTFTLLRLALSYRIRLPNWFLSVSILVDMSLLMTLIWSFHLQYRQPPSFYLKAPTLLYAFIFISLRALRFQMRYVLLAGLAAACGWMILVGYAISSDPTWITHSYVEYMNMNKILIGAEFDKIISFALVTAILALAISRARTLLVSAVSEGAAAEQFSRFLSSEAALRIRGSELPLAAGRGEARRTAVVCLDLRGFTRLAARMPPDEVMLFLSEYLDRLVPLITARGGYVDKFLGDGILVTLSEYAGENHVAAAFSMVDEVMAEIELWNADLRRLGKAPLRVGAAITAGTAIFGAVGGAGRLEYTVIGESVNLAAKLEKHNKTAGTRALTTAAAYALARAQGYQALASTSERPGSRIEGVDEPLDLVVLHA